MVSGSRDAWQRGQRTIWFNLVIGVSDEILPRDRSNENDRRTSKWQCEQLAATWVDPAASAFAMFNPARIIMRNVSSDATPAQSANGKRADRSPSEASTTSPTAKVARRAANAGAVTSPRQEGRAEASVLARPSNYANRRPGLSTRFILRLGRPLVRSARLVAR